MEIQHDLETLLNMIVVEKIDMKTGKTSSDFYKNIKQPQFHMKSMCAVPSRDETSADILVQMRFGKLIVAFCTLDKTRLETEKIIEIRNICSLGSSDLLDVILRKAEHVAGQFGVNGVWVYPDLSNVDYFIKRGYKIHDDFIGNKDVLEKLGSVISVLKDQFIATYREKISQVTLVEDHEKALFEILTKFYTQNISKTIVDGELKLKLFKEQALRLEKDYMKIPKDDIIPMHRSFGVHLSSISNIDKSIFDFNKKEYVPGQGDGSVPGQKREINDLLINYRELIKELSPTVYNIKDMNNEQLLSFKTDIMKDLNQLRLTCQFGIGPDYISDITEDPKSLPHYMVIIRIGGVLLSYLGLRELETNNSVMKIDLLCARENSRIGFKMLGYGEELSKKLGKTGMILESVPKALTFYSKNGYMVLNPESSSSVFDNSDSIVGMIEWANKLKKIKQTRKIKRDVNRSNLGSSDLSLLEKYFENIYGEDIDYIYTEENQDTLKTWSSILKNNNQFELLKAKEGMLIIMTKHIKMDL